MGIDINYTVGVGYKLTEKQSEQVYDYLDENMMVAEELNTENIRLVRYGISEDEGYIAFFYNDEWHPLTEEKHPTTSIQGFTLPEPDSSYGIPFAISNKSWRQLDVFFEKLGMIPEDEAENVQFYETVLYNTKLYFAVDLW